MGVPLNWMPCEIVSLRLKISVPLSVITLLVDSDPLAPPFPNCKFAPELMVVAPE